MKKYNPKGLPVAPRMTGPISPEQEGKHKGAIQIGPDDKLGERPPHREGGGTPSRP